MTTEIEKELFEKYGYKPTYIYYIAHKVGGCWNKYMQTSAKEYVKLKFQNEKELKIYKVDIIYPPITAEKVLRLIELAFNRTKSIQQGFNDGWIYFTNDEIKETSNSASRIVGYGKNTNDAIFNFLCHIYQNLTPQERNEVKSILES